MKGYKVSAATHNCASAKCTVSADAACLADTCAKSAVSETVCDVSAKKIVKTDLTGVCAASPCASGTAGDVTACCQASCLSIGGSGQYTTAKIDEACAAAKATYVHKGDGTQACA